MSIIISLKSRSNTSCELCSTNENLASFLVEPERNNDENDHILICGTCRNQIENPDEMDANHWRCLNDSMWSEIKVVQVMAWRILHSIRSEGWPQDLLDMLYLDDETLEWAQSNIGDEQEKAVIHKDSNGIVLQNGDSVVLIKDLKVKGSSMVAKRGTAVRRISLDHENEEYIEGKVDGQHIVLITKYVKKI